MGFFELIGIAVVLYYIVYILSWFLLDSDLELFIKEKVGKPISSLKGEVVWITGASSGIGKYLAIVLARNGVRLCLSARRDAELEAVKELCLRASNGSLAASDVMVMKMDMLDIPQHQHFFDRVVKYFGHVDVMVNNAGRSQRAAWQDIELTVDRELFELDVFAVVNLSRCYIKYLLAKNVIGHIAVTSSGAGLLGVPMSCSYVGAKHALHGYFEALRTEQPQIAVTIFCPGPTTTEFLQEAFTNEPGKVYGGECKDSSKRMTAERCGVLMATAIANKLAMNFVGPFPVPMLIAISLYYPNIKKILLNIIGAKGLKNIRDPEERK